MKSNEPYIMERVSQHHQTAWDYVEKKVDILSVLFFMALKIIT